MCWALRVVDGDNTSYGEITLGPPQETAKRQKRTGVGGSHPIWQTSNDVERKSQAEERGFPEKA